MLNLEERIIQLLSLADKTLATTVHPSALASSYVSDEMFTELRSASLSFIKMVFGENHPFYKDFNTKVKNGYPSDVSNGKGILKAIKTEIDEGWLNTVKGIISSEIFSDFLDMANHLLNENYKDPAAVMIGSVLEEHLRQLCNKNDIDTEIKKPDKIIPKKADILNADLTKAGIYNKLDQKNVTAWLD